MVETPSELEVPRTQSPTVSDFGYSESIYTLNNQSFGPNQSFFATYSLEVQDLIHNIYYDLLKESGKNVDFFVFLKHWSRAKGYDSLLGG